VMEQHPKIESESARVRFVNFGASSLDLELFAYVITRDYAEYLAVQEDLFFQIIKVVESNQTAFAYPVRKMILHTTDAAALEGQKAAKTPAD